MIIMSLNVSLIFSPESKNISTAVKESTDNYVYIFMNEV